MKTNILIIAFLSLIVTVSAFLYWMNYSSTERLTDTSNQEPLLPSSSAQPSTSLQIKEYKQTEILPKQRSTVEVLDQEKRIQPGYNSEGIPTRSSPLGKFLSRSDQALLALSEEDVRTLRKELMECKDSYLNQASHYVVRVAERETQHVLELKIPAKLRQDIRRQLLEVMGKYTQHLSEADRRRMAHSPSIFSEFLYPNAETVTFVLDFDSKSIVEANAVRVEKRFTATNHPLLNGFKTAGIVTIDKFQNELGPLLGPSLTM